MLRHSRGRGGGEDLTLTLIPSTIMTWWYACVGVSGGSRLVSVETMNDRVQQLFTTIADTL